MEQWLERKISSKTIFSPANVADNMCLTRAVAVAIAKEGMSRHAFYRVKQANSVIQRNEALKLCEMAQIDRDTPCGLDEVQKLQAVLNGYRLCVFTDKRGKECVFKGKYTPAMKNLYLLLHSGHFYAILYPCQAFDFHFECQKCVVFYTNRGEHRCGAACWRCLGPEEHNDANLKRCPTCHHQFAGEECFNMHQTLKLSNTIFTKCDTFKFCVGCETSYSTQRGRKHACEFVYCEYCKQNVRENHLCYMVGWEAKEKKEKWNYVTIYYDFETDQSSPVEGRENTFEHRPNLLVSQAVCDKCSDIPLNDYFCTVCMTRQHIFHNLDDQNINVVGQFLNYLRSFPKKTEILLIAHNAKSFDSVFFLQELIAQQIKPDLILNGAKILSMKVCFYQCPLVLCLNRLDCMS
jgi:hypothetical protein